MEYAAIANCGSWRAERDLEPRCPELDSGSQTNEYEYAAIAQLVEQGTENPCVLGSIPSCGIFFWVENYRFQRPWFPLVKMILNHFHSAE